MSVIELLLADGRFPGGGFAHSGGLEAAVGDGSVHDASSLEAFCQGRLHSAGPLEGWLAARACALTSAAGPDGGPGCQTAVIDDLRLLEAEAEAHQPSPALRAAARNQGRGLRRVAAVLWPAVDLGGLEVQPVVLGAVAAIAGLKPPGAARLAISGLVMAIVSAAPKLLALDMADAMAVAVRLAPETEAVARAACATTVAPIRSAPLVELRAEHHVTWEVRLFAS